MRRVLALIGVLFVVAACSPPTTSGGPPTSDSGSTTSSTTTTLDPGPTEPVPATNSFDDLGIYRDGEWYVRSGAAGNGEIPWAWGALHGGHAGDIPFTGDFNKDGWSDFGIYRDGDWFVRSGVDTGQMLLDGVHHGGWEGDVPVVGDFNNDDFSDLGIYRDGVWYVRSGTGDHSEIPWAWGVNHGGWAGDIPVVGDFDRDGYSDFGIYRAGQWFVRNGVDVSRMIVDGVNHGGWAGDIPVVGDFNKDGYDDFGIYRSGYWYVRSGVDVGQRPVWGTYHGGHPGDIPLAGDFDGDGRVTTPPPNTNAVDAFVAARNGTCVDFDGRYGAQCVDLVAYYNRDVIHAAGTGGDAWKWWTGYDHSKYTQVSASADPQKGDIAVWGSTLPGSDGAGHIAIVLRNVSSTQVEVFDQNFPRGSCSSIGTRSKAHLLGYLRPNSIG